MSHSWTEHFGVSSGGGPGPEIKVLDLDRTRCFLARLDLNRRILFSLVLPQCWNIWLLPKKRVILLQGSKNVLLFP